MDNLTRSLNEIRASNSWRNFLRDNKKLGPIVRGYLAGTGRRPTEAELGQNHYARGLVLIEDERRRRSVHPLWKRDVVFSRTLSNFSGNERTAALTRGWCSGSRYMASQKTSQMKPSDAVSTNAHRHPKCSVM